MIIFLSSGAIAIIILVILIFFLAGIEYIGSAFFYVGIIICILVAVLNAICSIFTISSCKKGIIPGVINAVRMYWQLPVIYEIFKYISTSSNDGLGGAFIAIVTIFIALPMYGAILFLIECLSLGGIALSVDDDKAYNSILGYIMVIGALLLTIALNTWLCNG